MYNLNLESSVNNTAIYSMDYLTAAMLEDEDQKAAMEGSDDYPMWNRVEAAIKAKYPTASVKGSYDDVERFTITVTVH